MAIDWFTTIAARRELSCDTVQALDDRGFVVIPGPVSAERLLALAVAYDAVMEEADTSERNLATIRVHDFVNRGPAFDDLYIFQPVLEAACHVIRRPFKISTVLGRTLKPYTEPQGLHVDFARDAADRSAHAWPMIGFILMVDEFTSDNGATRFVAGSHLWSDVRRRLPVAQEMQVAACGPAGSVIVYNGSVWHGHGANRTHRPRRSIQASYIKRDAQSVGNLPARMRPDTLGRIGQLATYLLDLASDRPGRNETT